MESVLRDPTQRTYLHSYPVTRKLLLLLLGAILVIAGPLASWIVHGNVNASVRARQRITRDDGCFVATTERRLCPEEIAVEMTFFSVQNEADVISGSQAPQTQLAGPYTFTARDVHTDVAYPSKDVVSFEQRPWELTPNCDDCDWDSEITILHDNVFESDKPEQLAELLLNKAPKIVELHTGVGDNDAVYDVIAFGDARPMSSVKYNGRIFGESFDASNPASIFDFWLETELEIATIGDREEIRDVDAVRLSPLTTIDCPESCEWPIWPTGSDSNGTQFSLPFLHESTNASFPSSASRDHLTELTVDITYGYTLSSKAEYQLNHWIDSYGGDPFWAASHWMRVSWESSEEDVKSIRDAQRKKALSLWLLTVAVTLTGALIAVMAIGLLFCTATARKRLADIAFRSRTRARDAKLKPTQFRFLGKFLQRQTRNEPGQTETPEKPTVAP